jgi:hypothetical protein
MIVPNIENEELSNELNCVSFSEEIEFTVVDKKADGYMDAIIKFCDSHGFDFSDILKYISPALKEKIQLEAEQNGLLKKNSKTTWDF